MDNNTSSMPARTLSELIERLHPLQVAGDVNIAITSVECDSRLCHSGSLFVATHGVAIDSHRFIDAVINAGAVAVVCQELPDTLSPNVTYVHVADSTEALAVLAAAWYGYPSEQLHLVGVTGTNGKTTVATLLYRLTTLLGYRAGLLSTVANIIGERRMDAVQTTPDHLTLNRLLHEMVAIGCEYAFMEVSSHACAQKRIDGLRFAGAVFTNLTRDHLDYHRTAANYLAAKKRFFDLLPPDAFALVNIDDKVGNVMLQNCRASHHSYSLRSLADFRTRLVEQRLDGSHLVINGSDVEMQFVGRFNAYNLTAVFGAATLLGFDKEQVLVAMSRLQPVQGRFQTIHAPQSGVTAVVDYAHTPDALTNVLDTLLSVVGSRDRIIVVVGCGGDRDKGKRPMMASVAATRCRLLVLTSDNPRSENPDDILADMQAGLDPDMARHTITIADRAAAIRTAVATARSGDVVLVAGKGHEQYQEIAGVKHHFDDMEQLQQAFGMNEPSV